MTRRPDWRGTTASPFGFMGSELARLIEDYLRSAPASDREGTPTDLDPQSWQPVVDVFDSPEELVILAEIPGVDPASIDLSVTGQQLSLRGVKPPSTVPNAHRLLRERREGPFHRELTLPGDVDFERAEAHAANGILTVKLPKKVSSKPRTIPIRPH